MQILVVGLIIITMISVLMVLIGLVHLMVIVVIVCTFVIIELIQPITIFVVRGSLWDVLKIRKSYSDLIKKEINNNKYSYKNRGIFCYLYWNNDNIYVYIVDGIIHFMHRWKY